jgi:predicted ATPase/class 3 adenylate cyclase/DNA-binding CsgD family transcriptional regulator
MVVREGRTALGDRPDLAWGAEMSELLSGTPVVPEGTVTFLLTDVEGSTERWQTEPDAMAAAIARHYELLGEVVEAHHGARPTEQGEGDSIVAAFARPTDALRAALEGQRRLAAEPWPTGTPLLVRMAIHTGEARLRDESNYVGPAVIRTARLRAIAHGGQVVLSSAAADLMADALPREVELLDVGVHRLKDLARPERVWQLAHPDLERSFPPLRSLDATPNNLPIPLTTFIGRFDDIDTVVRLVLDNRLVTLMGAGGAGKTRLAQQVGGELAESFPDGVWWVDLVEVTEPELLPSAVSRTLSLPEDRADRLGGVARRLASMRALLIFDNCEHLVEASAQAADTILRTGVDVRVLATSRAPLNVPGELSWRVPQLGLPDLAAGTDVERALRSDAVRLFTDRARRVRTEFRLREDNVADVVAVCDRLDGIPLAIELAAARCKLLSPSQLLQGLNDAVGVLGSGPRTVDERHQTIERSIAWSHSLLSPTARVVLRRTGTFAGPFSLDAATAVIPDHEIDSSEVLAALEELVDQSLVQADEQGSEVRFRLLETVRQFARRELSAADETARLTARHAEYFQQRALALWPLFHDGLSAILDQVEVEHLDLAAMLDHLTEHGTAEDAVAVAMACLPALGVRHTAEAAALGERVAARVEPLSVLEGNLRLRLALADPMNQQHVAAGVAAAEATQDPDLARQAAYFGTWQAAGAEPTLEHRDRLEDRIRRLDEIGEGHFAYAHWTVATLDRGMGRLDDAVRAWRRSAAETRCRRCNTMVWSEGALLALARGDLGAAEAALERAWSFAVGVRDAGFSAHVRLTEVEVAAYRGSPWGAAVVERELAVGGGNPLALAYLSTARAIGAILDGRHDDVDHDLATGIEVLDDQWSKQNDSRLRQIAVHQARGELDAACRALDELEDLARRFDAGPGLLAGIAHRAAALALDRGDPATADDRAHESLVQAAMGPWPPLVVAALEVLSSVAVARESYAEAARLHGAAAHIRDEVGYRYDVEPERSRLARDLQSARLALGDEDFEAAVASARGLTLDDAIAYARRARGERKRPSHGWDGLTPMERQVADLAVAGLSNAQIAERLFIGRETVKTHLSNAYAKVGVANRTQLVADAAKHGIT